MRPSVLLLTNEYPPEKIAGTAMSTQFLAEELATRGYRVTVVVNTRQNAPSRESNGTLEVIRLRPLGLRMTRMVQRAALLVNVARRIRPDLIQGQSLSCGFLALLAGKCLRVPTVAYAQGLDLYQSGTWARRTYIRWALMHSTRVAVVTKDLQSIAQNLSGRRGEVIPHGLKWRSDHEIDRQTARSLLDLPQAGRVVLFVGRLIRLKGVAHLIRAMPRVVARYPDTRLILVGDGEERTALTSLTRALGLGNSVSFAGERSHGDVIRFMRAADLFVLPSLVESFGIVLVEAMSCGLPIVASDVMGIPSIVEEPTNGFLIPPGDEVALAKRIAQLLSNPAERAAIGRQNVEAAKGYAISRIADRFLDLWDSMMPGHPVPRSEGHAAQCDLGGGSSLGRARQ